MVIGKPLVCVIQHAAEGAFGIQIKAWHGYFTDAQAPKCSLDPKLQGHSPTRFGDVEPGQRLAPICLEAAKCIREIEAEPVSQLAGDVPIDALPLRRSVIVLAEVAQIAAAGHHVHTAECLQEDRNAGRLVLAVAIHGDQHVKIVIERVLKRRDKGGAVALVVAVRDDAQPRFLGEQLAGTIRGPVVYHQHIRTVAADFMKNFFHMPLFVVDGNGGQ